MPLFQKGEVLPLVLFGEGPAGNHPRTPTVHFEGPHSADDHGNVGDKAGNPTFHIPKFLKPNIRTEPRFRHVVIEKL
jgi:hypothetical protein